MQLIILLIEFTLLFFIARAVTQTLFLFFWRLGNNRPLALSLTTLLLFPGTVIHELSHLFTAEVLGVATGNLTLVPEGLGEENSVRTGSVSIAKTDPFRRAVIGIAPVIVGLAALAVLAYFIPGVWQSVTTSSQPLHQNPSAYWLLLIGYLLFAVSNSLFASPEDLVGFWPLAITLSLLVAAAYVAGFRLELTGPVLTISLEVLMALIKSLAVVLALNIILLLIMNGLIALTGKSNK